MVTPSGTLIVTKSDTIRPDWSLDVDQEFSFGEWIRKGRTVLGLTQEALDKQVGYSAAMLPKIENDERRTSERGAAGLAVDGGTPADREHPEAVV